jgi:CubicO group peptidase (beta-lactamase class C family)
MKAQLTRRLRTGAAELRSVEALLVSVGGRTVLTYYHNREPTGYSHVWSVTKSVLSILIGIAIQEGYLRLDQTLAELLPDYLGQMSPQVAGITLRQLLTMTSGVPGGRSGVFTLEADDPVALIILYGLTTDPGASFDYSNAGSHLVAAALTQATGVSVLDYARAKLFDPLDIPTRPAWEGWDYGSSTFSRSGFAWSKDRKGVHSGCCGLRLRATDMLKIGMLYANQGNWDGRQIVPADWVRESTSPQVTPEQLAGAGDYGYLWHIRSARGHHIYLAEGSYGQLIWVVPDLQLVVVLSCRDAGPYEGITDTVFPVIDEVVFQPLA